MLADKRLGRLVHPLFVQRPKGPTHLAVLDAGPYRVIVDHVAVAPIQRREPGMEVTGTIAGPVHGYVEWQVGVDAHDPGAKVANRRGFEMCYLETGVHTGIGSSGTHQLHRMIRYFRHRPGQFCLNRPNTAFLLLPAMKGPAIVFENQRHSAIADVAIRGQRLWLLEQGSSGIAV